MPQVSEWVTEMSGKPVLRGINVDEAVALGAALTAHMEVNAGKGEMMLTGQKSFTDVMSHSLGMVAENEDRSRYINSIIIPKNLGIPTRETRPFKVKTSAAKGGQMEVYMVQGEAQRPLDNQVIGKYTFSGIGHEKSGQAVLDVTYSYDRNGVIDVEAIQTSSGQQLKLDVEPVPADLRWMDEAPKDHVEEGFDHLSVIFAIDLSGSMYGEPIRKAKEAAKGFVEKLDLTHTSVGLLLFADRCKMDTKLTQSYKELVKGIDKWGSGSGVGGGNMAEPFTLAHKHLKDVEGHRFLVVLTDGVWYDQSKAIRQAKKCHESNIGVIAIGFGGADRQFLKDVASADEDALFVDLSNLSESLSKIGQVLTSGGKLTAHT